MNAEQMAGVMSSASSEWATPQDFFDALNAEFHFGIDVAANKGNTKCRLYFNKKADALGREWWPFSPCWMNPPYGREIGKWMKKAYEESQKGATVVCLVPARTDTAWWWDYAMKGEIRFVRGRLRFVRDDGKSDAALFPSAVIVFRPTIHPRVPAHAGREEGRDA